jgi:membrane protein
MARQDAKSWDDSKVRSAVEAQKAAREVVREADRRRSHARAEEPGRGREAERPREIPWQGWKDVLKRTWQEIGADNLGLVSAGVAFYWMLALFPAMAALISLYGLVADPADVQRQVDAVSFLMPAEVAQVIKEQLIAVVQGAPTGLSLGVLVSLAITIYSATKGTKAIIQALNIAYEEEERRSFIRHNLLALGLTLAGIVVFLIALGLIVLLPFVLQAVWLDFAAESVMLVGRWVLLAGLIFVMLVLVYRWAPNRRDPKFRWVAVGAAVATLLWLLGSLVFAWYVQAFGSYNKTYGSIGAVIVTLLWLYVSAYIVLLGAELNSEIEHQTAQDTTVGPGRPLGERGAFMADSVGKRHDEKY